VISFVEEFSHDLSGGVIGISNKEKRFTNSQGFDEGYHLVEEGSVVPV
jgi:hypothetical protein